MSVRDFLFQYQVPVSVHSICEPVHAVGAVVSSNPINLIQFKLKLTSKMPSREELSKPSCEQLAKILMDFTIATATRLVCTKDLSGPLFPALILPKVIDGK